MNTLQHNQTQDPKNGVFGLRVLQASPYFSARRGAVKEKLMTLKCFVLGYAPSGGTAAAVALLESSDASIVGPITVPLSISYSDTDATIHSAVQTAIDAYCTGTLSTQAPDTYVWDTVTPTDLLAAIPASATSYQTIVSQTGTATPTAGITPITTYPSGTTFTWARSSAGVYTLTASTAVFSTIKTAVFISPLTNLNAQARGVVTSTTVITFTTAIGSLLGLGLLGFTATNTDALLSNTMVYVQTYS